MEFLFLSKTKKHKLSEIDFACNLVDSTSNRQALMKATLPMLVGTSIANRVRIIHKIVMMMIMMIAMIANDDDD